MNKKLRIPTFLLLLAFVCASVGVLSACSPKTYGTYVLVADFSNGSPEPLLRFLEVDITAPLDDKGYADISKELAAELTRWTGLNFTLNDVTLVDGSNLMVDWSETSTLLTGVARMRKEGFELSDAVSVNWFMLDTLAATLKQNAPFFAGTDVEVYYSSGGESIKFINPEEMQIVAGMTELPADLPYRGSAYYTENSGQGINPVSIPWGGVYRNDDDDITLGIGAFDGRTFEFLFTITETGYKYNGIADVNPANPFQAETEDFAFSFDGEDTITVTGLDDVSGGYGRQLTVDN